MEGLRRRLAENPELLERLRKNPEFREQFRRRIEGLRQKLGESPRRKGLRQDARRPGRPGQPGIKKSMPERGGMLEFNRAMFQRLKEQIKREIINELKKYLRKHFKKLKR